MATIVISYIVKFYLLEKVLRFIFPDKMIAQQFCHQMWG